MQLFDKCIVMEIFDVQHSVIISIPWTHHDPWRDQVSKCHAWAVSIYCVEFFFFFKSSRTTAVIQITTRYGIAPDPDSDSC